MSDLREQMRQRCKDSLYFLCKAVLGFEDFEPDLHLQLCNTIQSSEWRRKLILIPRGCFKSSAGSIGYPIWLLINNPNERILLGSSTATLAQHFLRRIKSVFERNEMFQWLFPEIIPDWKSVKKWTENEIQLPRPSDFPEASIETMGVGGRVTGRHYTVMIKDDLIEEQSANSLDELAKVKQWHDYSESLFDNIDLGIELVIGTRWHAADLYGHIISNDTRYHVTLRKAIEDGESIFPKRLSMQLLEQMRKTKPAIFATQYMNDPLKEGLTEFQESWVMDFEYTSDYSSLSRSDGKTVRISDINRYIHVDPAISDKPGACRSAIMVTGMDKDGKVYMLDMWAKRGAGISETVDTILRLHRRWRPICTTIETIAYQKALAQILKERAISTGQYVYIVEYRPGSIKEGRIRRLQDYFIKGLALPKIHPMRSEFLTEYVQFPIGMSVDMLDALAQGPDVWKRPMVDVEHLAEDDYELVGGGRNAVTGY